MADILQEIVAHKRAELELMKSRLPERELRITVERLIDGSAPLPSMAKALRESSGIIAEFKRRSPSKGWIRQDADAAVIPQGYERSGASAVSILTDTKFFGGTDTDIVTARRSGTSIPILYKNFVIDEYQLLQARLCGASAALLIAACLSKDEYRQLHRAAHGLGMEVLLETHSEREIDYAETVPDMCGVNNRNLGTFVTDVQNSFRLAELMPSGTVRVSESGISSPDTVSALKAAGFEGFLIGENFMRHDDPAAALGNFINQLNSQP